MIISSAVKARLESLRRQHVNTFKVSREPTRMVPRLTRRLLVFRSISLHAGPVFRPISPHVGLLSAPSLYMPACFRSISLHAGLFSVPSLYMLVCFALHISTRQLVLRSISLHAGLFCVPSLYTPACFPFHLFTCRFVLRSISLRADLFSVPSLYTIAITCYVSQFLLPNGALQKLGRRHRQLESDI